MLNNNRKTWIFKKSILLKKSEVPLYRQIKAWILKEISEGHFRPGEIFPSEVELSQKIGVTRITVRQATNELVAEGMLFREKGKRPRVAKPKVVTQFLELAGITHYVGGRKENYICRVLQSELLSASAEIAKELKIHKNSRVFVLERRRSINGEVFGWEKTFISRRLCP